jgi:hypothetical protein
MPRQPKPYFRVTVYQMHGSLSSAALIRAKYLDRPEFEVQNVRVGVRDGIFVRGSPKYRSGTLGFARGWLGA